MSGKLCHSLDSSQPWPVPDGLDMKVEFEELGKLKIADPDEHRKENNGYKMNGIC